MIRTMVYITILGWCLVVIAQFHHYVERRVGDAIVLGSSIQRKDAERRARAIAGCFYFNESTERWIVQNLKDC